MPDRTDPASPCRVDPSDVIDMHVHVGLCGDTEPMRFGHFSAEYRKTAAFKVFLKYAGIKAGELSDETIRRKTIEVIDKSKIGKVVCLALDHYFDSKTGDAEPYRSHMWVSNEYIADRLRSDPLVRDKILLGASVSPNDRGNFQRRVDECVREGAVLMKWLPSAQGINLADDHVRDAMVYLSTAKPGARPLPLLLHTGPEYAIPTPTDREWMVVFNYLSWSDSDARIHKRILDRESLCVPDVARANSNIEAALNAGAVIIFAHCGTPYFTTNPNLEHSDFEIVKTYLARSANGEFRGKCYADISAFAIPFRRPFFDDLKKLPSHTLVYGSDFPVPVFELSAGPAEWFDDLWNVIKSGKLDRIVIPEGNLLDVSLSEMCRVFKGRPEVFTEFNGLIS